MRVLLVSHHYPPDAVGGVERISQSFATELQALGDTVAVTSRRFGPTVPPSLVTDVSPEGATVYRLSGGDFATETFLDWHAELEQLFGRVVAETKPDVVHVLHLRGLSPRMVSMARGSGAGVVVSVLDYYFACPRIVLVKNTGEWCAGPNGGRECAATCFADEGAGARRWETRAAYWSTLLQVPHRIIAPSQFVSEFFQRHGAPVDKLRVLQNGISLPPRDWDAQTQANGDTPLRLLFLGTVLPHKGTHLILDALQQAEVGKVDLLVAGSALDIDYIRRLRAQAAAIPGLRMRMYGEYELAELPTLMQGADCVITPSAWHEAFGIVTREALFYDIPVIVSRVGGLGEAVVEGENGFTFSPEHPKELAAIFKRLVNEPDLLPHIRAGAHATKILSNAEHVRAVRDVYVEAQQAARTASNAPDPALDGLFDRLVAEGFDSKT